MYSEVRLGLEQILQLSGGDYFEHAILLQLGLQSLGINSYIARVSTQTLVNEYFVLALAPEEVTLVDPVSGRGYIIQALDEEGKMQITLQPYI